jgi:hypothetical protein
MCGGYHEDDSYEWIVCAWNNNKLIGLQREEDGN